MKKKVELNKDGTPKRPRGRKVARGEKASGRLVLSMLPVEERRIRAAAAAAGMEISPWARGVLLASAPELPAEGQ
jgi:hypothetical protein